MTRRVVTVDRSIGLADVRPDTTARLDALARIVQDVADADAATAPIEGMGVWIMRRIDMQIAHVPRLRAEVRASTWCSGVGPRWAERRSELHVGELLCATVTALWVHTDPARGTSIPLPDGFDAVWGATADRRRVSARLHHAPPPGEAHGSTWVVRATDLDVVGHVNNAAYWSAVEEELARRGGPRVVDAEMEFRAGLDHGEPVDMLVADTPDGFAVWLCVDGDVRASALVGCAP